MPHKMLLKSDKSALANMSLFFNTPQILKLSDSTHREYLVDTSKNLAIKSKKNQTIADIYDELYNVLLQKYRCEYVYKNEIAKQLLKEKHPNNDAVLLSEVGVHDSKADILIINGTSSVYEIKSELDSLDRLYKQINSYRLVFDKIYTVSNYDKIKSVSKVLGKDIGIIALDNDGRLNEIRKAKSNLSNVSPAHIFNLLHKEEYTRIIQKHFGEVPNVQPVYFFSECKKMFCELNSEAAHKYMIQELKKRIKPSYRVEFSQSLPHSLQLLASTGKISKRDCLMLTDILKVKL